MILSDPLAVIWLAVLRENRQWVLVVPISVFRQDTVTLRTPGAAEQEQLCMIREQFPEVPSVSERAQGAVVNGMPTDEILKMSLALSTACDEIELMRRLLSYLVRVSVPKPAMVSEVGTEVRVNAEGKKMERVSVWKRGVERTRSKRRVAGDWTIPLLMLIDEKVVGWMSLIVILQESISPMSPLLVCVYMLMKSTSGLVEGGILRVIVKEEVNGAWKRNDSGQMEGKLVSEHAGLMGVPVGSSGYVVGTETKISQLLLLAPLMQEEEQVTAICPSVKAQGLETVIAHRAFPPTMVTAAPLEPLSTTDALGERMVMAVSGEQSPPGAGLVIFETATEKLDGDKALEEANICLTNRTEPEKAHVALAPVSPL